VGGLGQRRDRVTWVLSILQGWTSRKETGNGQTKEEAYAVLWARAAGA